MNDRSDGQPPSQPETPQVVGDSGAVTMIPIADIWVGDRLLPLDEKRIAEIGQSYDDVGQISPITLARVIGPAGEPIRLLTGFHRLVTHKRKGGSTIASIIVETSDPVQWGMMEIDENLCRGKLSAAQRALLTHHRAADASAHCAFSNISRPCFALSTSSFGVRRSVILRRLQKYELFRTASALPEPSSDPARPRSARRSMTVVARRQ